MTEVHVTYDPETAGGQAPDGRKVKATMHWVSAATALEAEVRLYDRLFLSAQPSGGGADPLDDVNPDSMSVVANAMLEPGLADTPLGDVVQFETYWLFRTRRGPPADLSSDGWGCATSGLVSRNATAEPGDHHHSSPESGDTEPRFSTGWFWLPFSWEQPWRGGYRYDGVTLFLFVVTGWAVSLALHEFGHAIVAYKGGDRSVAGQGLSHTRRPKIRRH